MTSVYWVQDGRSLWSKSVLLASWTKNRCTTAVISFIWTTFHVFIYNLEAYVVVKKSFFERSPWQDSMFHVLVSHRISHFSQRKPQMETYHQKIGQQISRYVMLSTKLRKGKFFSFLFWVQLRQPVCVQWRP